MGSFLVIFRLRTATLQKKELHDKALDKFKYFQMNFFTEHLQATTSDDEKCTHIRRVSSICRNLKGSACELYFCGGNSF